MDYWEGETAKRQKIQQFGRSGFSKKDNSYKPVNNKNESLIQSLYPLIQYNASTLSRLT